MKFPSVILLLIVIASLGCGSSYNASSSMPGSAVQIQQLMPMSAAAGGPGFVLTVNGSGFGSDAIVYWNATAQITTYATGNQVTANIPASAIVNRGMVPVYVRTHGTNSNTVDFTVN